MDVWVMEKVCLILWQTSGCPGEKALFIYLRKVEVSSLAEKYNISIKMALIEDDKQMRPIVLIKMNLLSQEDSFFRILVLCFLLSSHAACFTELNLKDFLQCCSFQLYHT